MVGVAGKSKGCATCRRRKIKCDETKPSCLKCQRSQLACEGYARYPVFIRRGTAGYERRRPLEETRPVVAIAGPNDLVSSQLEASRCISWFWVSFARFPPSRYALQSPTNWISCVLDWKGPQQALQKALLAVAVLRMGRMQQRQDLILTSRQLYGQSLKTTRRSLTHPTQSMEVEVLATTCIMVLFELFLASNSHNISGWSDHIAGVAQLLQYRGAEAHADGVAHAIFEHCRYLLMLKHVFSRKSSVLGRDEWLTQPWHGIEKSPEQRVFDGGFRLASLLERRDALLETESGLTKTSVRAFLEDCLKAHEEVTFVLKLCIEPGLASELDRGTGGPSSETSVLNSTAGRLLNVSALGFRLGISSAAFDVYSKSKDMSLELEDVSSEGKISTERLLGRIEAITANRKALALQILYFTEYIISAPVGVLGAARMMLALQPVKVLLGSSGIDLERCNKCEVKLLGQQDSRIPTPPHGGPSLTEEQVKNRPPDLVKGNMSAIASFWQEFSSARRSV